MKKSKPKPTVSLTQIRNLLKEVVFNPRKPGPMAVIADVGSSEYYELRAIEAVNEARYVRQQYAAVEFTSSGQDLYHAHLTKAIQLLLLARLNM